MVLEQRRREQNGKRTTQAVAGQPDLLHHALAASRGGDEPPTNAAPWKAEQEVGALLQPVSGALAPYRPSQRYHLLDERHVGRDDLPRPNLVTVVVWLEQSRSQWDLIPVTGIVWECLPSPEDGELRQVFLDWVLEILRRVLPEGETLPAEMTWEEMQMTLVERAAEWPKQWFREGRKEGREEGRKEGREEVREEGLAHERALLRRMAASRFGADTADRLSGMLAGISDPERLAEVGEWLVRCDSGEEFLARVESHGPRDS